MKRAMRLRRPEQFQRVRRDGRRHDDPLVMLNAAPSRRRTTRCGFVVAKRIGNAVARNRARRRLREAVRLMFDRVAPGWDLVFIARSPLLTTVSFPQLQQIVERLVQRAGALADPPAHMES